MTKRAIKAYSEWERSEIEGPVAIVRKYTRRFPHVSRAKAIATLSKKGIAKSTISTNRYYELKAMEAEGIL